ncbi:hypothetical protein [uncultured Fusobacterium sp.]|uniref:AbiTii domain-containing protein n=1 Tax=uncultured Fusobacterium sp. TaxID=159267 RepID=UPI0027DAEF7A|nr:hypothetical protein [uncultured Fusobacterium sp.]
MSLVLELQKEIIDNTISGIDTLRKAYAISRKLAINNMSEWLNNELNGYKDMNEIPEYRNINGIIEAFNPFYGWCPVGFDDIEVEDTFSNLRINNPISELEKMIEKSEEGMIYLDTTGTINLRNELQVKIRFKTSVPAFSKIVDIVKNMILEWTLELEKNGILGKEMTFSAEEKEKSQQIVSINISGGNNVINSEGAKQFLENEIK